MTATAADRPSKRLERLGIVLPEPEPTVYGYVPLTIHGSIAYLAGQICKVPGGLLVTGRVGADVSPQAAGQAARASVLQALAWLDRRAGGIDNVERVLRLDCYVAVDDVFDCISDVADSASELLVATFGPAGGHPRSVIGVARLPRNAPVLLEMTVALLTTPDDDRSADGASPATRRSDATQ